MISFKIAIPEKLIFPYYSVFGHFFLDHLFQLYKIKCWYEDINKIKVECLIIENFDSLKNKYHFIEPFYKCIFSRIVGSDKKYHEKIINVGVIMGSKINSENDNIYLSKSILGINIPNDIIENGRKNTKINKLYINSLSKIIKTSMNISTSEIIDEKNILIIDRKNSPRKLKHLDILIQNLEKRKYKCVVVQFDKMPLIEQIQLVNNYTNIIAACGSVQVHIAFMQEKTRYIELCESGFRYPNTSIYGNYFNINTYSISFPLVEEYNVIRNKNKATKLLFFEGDNFPNIITNSNSDISREKNYYSKLMNLGCFNIHTIQDIYCEKYLSSIEKILN